MAMWSWLIGWKDSPQGDVAEEDFDFGNTIHIASHDFIGLRALTERAVHAGLG